MDSQSTTNRIFYCRIIQDSTDELNYMERVEEHNTRFGKERTEATYKLRAKKIAKEKNLSLKTNSFWTDEEKQELIAQVNAQPLEPDWENICIQMKRTETSVRNMYNDLVSPMTQVLHSTSVIDLCMIEKLMSTMCHTCSMCSKKEYTNPFVWKDKTYCEECYIQQFGGEVEERWKQVHAYSISKGKTSCNLCGKNAVFDNSIGMRFHYDHVDMFDKSISVCEVVRKGRPIIDAYSEIDRCQLACVSCHRLITKIEHQCGFIRLKRQMIREYEEMIDDQKRAELTTEYSKIYSTWMDRIYAVMKASR